MFSTCSDLPDGGFTRKTKVGVSPDRRTAPRWT